MVLVAFRFEEKGSVGIIPNNFVVSAWGVVMRR
jgi:hypothetical protein